MGGGQSSPVFPCVGPCHGGTGSKRRGWGFPTSIGTRRRRGSNGQASTKGGDSGPSSMRRCSRRGGEGRRRAVRVVWRGGDGGSFYRGGQAVVGRGDDQLGGGDALSRGGRLW
jgi:hypothetical protein